MKIFVATSYSSQVNYDTSEVMPEYIAWLEDILKFIESRGHTVFCALRADKYKINSENPVAAFQLDMKHIKESDILFALLAETPSTGVQTEIGVAVALGKRVILAHDPKDEMAYFNKAMIASGVVREVKLPLNADSLDEAISSAAAL